MSASPTVREIVGGAIRLGLAASRVMVGEGIEICLAGMQATSEPAWAALSTSGMKALRLPPEVHEVVILADGDEPGQEAAQAAAARFTSEGRLVSTADPGAGLDFNDLLSRAAV